MGVDVTVSVRYFASIREALGPGEAVRMPVGSTVRETRDVLLARGGAHADALARGRGVRCALDQTQCGEDAVVPEACELAFFPPVTGG